MVMPVAHAVSASWSLSASLGILDLTGLLVSLLRPLSFLLDPLSLVCVTNVRAAQVWLQEFAWTEEEKISKLAQRSSVAGTISTTLQHEPMFCFGTAVKLFYWSHLVYDIKEVLPACSAMACVLHAICRGSTCVLAKLHITLQAQ